MGPSSMTADKMIKDILDTMTENDYNIVQEVLSEFKAKYIASADLGPDHLKLDEETDGFRIGDTSPKQRLYLKSLGFRVICRFDRTYGRTICTLNFK